jgi:hypothetical protein
VPLVPPVRLADAGRDGHFLHSGTDQFVKKYSSSGAQEKLFNPR